MRSRPIELVPDGSGNERPTSGPPTTVSVAATSPDDAAAPTVLVNSITSPLRRPASLSTMSAAITRDWW
ncbi:MAG TPA: hypothetical protein PLV68_21020 [Ilumatobacteraceae bacterium]|nr:hypothetical protein [Ilumatobacteraceae bacterium]